MKILYLVRHAKAVKRDDIPDFERPLEDRGKGDAAIVAGRLKDTVNPDALVSSPALRALETADIFAGILGYPADKIMKRKVLYDQTGTAFRTVIREMNDRFERLMIFGHNPSITDFARTLAPDFKGEIPSSGVVCIQLEASTWKEAAEGGGRVVCTEYPKHSPDNQSSKLLKKELESEITEAVHQTFRARNEAAAADLHETTRQAAKKLAVKFAKRMKALDKANSPERNRDMANRARRRES
jgi:phosphohistidine phosphatase